MSFHSTLKTSFQNFIDTIIGHTSIKGIGDGKITGAIAQINNDLSETKKIKFKSISGTTSASGNLKLNSFAYNKNAILQAYVTNVTSVLAIPYIAGDGNYYFHCITDASTYAVKANTTLSIDIYYIEM